MIIILAFAILFILALYFIKRSRLDFPGPPGWPIFGNIFSIDHTKMHVTFMEWSKRYGSIYRINLMGNEGLVITDIDVFNDLMVKRGSVFGGRPQMYELVNVIGRKGSEVVFGQPTEIWKKIKKMSHLTLKQHGTVSASTDQISKQVFSRMVNELAVAKGEPTNPYDTFYNTTIDIITSILVGKIYDKDSELRKLVLELEMQVQLIQKMRSSGALLDAFPFLDKIIDIFQTVREKYYSLVDSTAAIIFNDSEHSLFEGILASSFKACMENGTLTPTHCSMSIATLILAATRTTSNTLYAIVNILIHNIDIQRKLQQESNDVLGSEMVKLEDREYLPYHMATLEELFRYTIINPMGLPHTPLYDTTIQGKHVPAGTQIHFNHLGVNFNEKNYPDPYRFRPERFLDAEGKLVSANHPNRRNMNAFSGGPRVCPGEALVRARLFIFLASLMQKFNILPDEKSPLVSMDPRDHRFSVVTLSPSYKARFVPRVL